MNDARRASRSASHMPWNKSEHVCVLHASRVHAPSVFLLSSQQNANQSRFYWRPTATFPPRTSLKSDIVLHTCVNFNQFMELVNWPRSGFTSHWPCRQSRQCSEIPSATSVRLGWVKKESSLWLLSLWITPQYGITLQWMSADTIAAAQLWTIQQRFLLQSCNRISSDLVSAGIDLRLLPSFTLLYLASIEVSLQITT